MPEVVTLLVETQDGSRVPVPCDPAAVEILAVKLAAHPGIRSVTRHAGYRANKRARHVVLKSGGTARDRALNPIIAALKRDLIALADEHGNRTVVKYSDDQPRDEHGRWTGGGGEADATPVDLGDHTSYRQEDGTLTRWPDLRTAKADYESRHPGTKLYLGHLDGNKPIEVMAAIDKIEQLQAHFPSVNIVYVSTTAQTGRFEGRGVWGQCKYIGAGSAIELNPEYWRQDNHPILGAADALVVNRLYEPDSGFHPDGTSNPAGIMTHEFGHAVENHIDAQPGTGPNDLFAWLHASGDYYDGTMGPIQKMQDISTYAKKNDTEAFAETFAAAYTGGAAPTEVGDSLSQYLEGNGYYKP